MAVTSKYRVSCGDARFIHYRLEAKPTRRRKRKTRGLTHTIGCVPRVPRLGSEESGKIVRPSRRDERINGYRGRKGYSTTCGMAGKDRESPFDMAPRMIDPCQRRNSPSWDTMSYEGLSRTLHYPYEGRRLLFELSLIIYQRWMTSSYDPLSKCQRKKKALVGSSSNASDQSFMTTSRSGQYIPTL